MTILRFGDLVSEVPHPFLRPLFQTLRVLTEFGKDSSETSPEKFDGHPPLLSSIRIPITQKRNIDVNDRRDEKT